MPIPFFRDGLKRPKHLLMPLGILLAIGLASIALANLTAAKMTERRIDVVTKNARVLSDQLADALTIEIDQNLRYLHGVPVMLSRLPFLQAPLSRLPSYPNGNRDPLPLMRRARLLDAPGMLELNRSMDSSAQDLGLSLILVLNKAGICVSSSNYLWPDNIVGTDLSDRQYFYTALSGQATNEYAVGRRTSEPGIFFSAPVVDQGVVTGVVAVKVNVSEMANWIGNGQSFVADHNGVIVIAHDTNMLFKALAGAPVLAMTPQQQYRLYRRTHFDILNLAPLVSPGVSGVDLLEGQSGPVVISARSTQESKLTVYAISPVNDIYQIATERQRFFWLAYLSYLGFGIALAALTAYYIQHRRYINDTIALNVSLRNANLDLEYEVQHDPLTAVLNRGYFVKLLGNRINTEPAAEPFSVAVIDLDFFKRINDGYGHAAGDEALKAFATICQHALRASDQFGRIGGEEFAIILPDLDETLASTVLERMRQQVANTPILFHGHAIQLTVSVGVAAYRPGDNVDGVLYRADTALYRAKSNGRNQIVRYQDLVPPDSSILSSS